MKKYSFLAILMVFVLCLSMVMTGCGEDAKTENPDTTTTTTAPEEPLTMDLALTNTANALCGTELSVGALEDLEQKKTVTVSIDQMFTNVLKMDLSNMAFYDELSVSSEGDGVNPDIKVNLYCDGTDIAMVSPDLFATEEAMGCTMESLVTSLMEAVSGEVSGAALGGLSQYAEVLADIANDTDGAERVLKDLQKALEGVTASESKGTVPVDGKDVEAVIFTYTMDKETLLDLVDVYLKYTAENYQKMMDAMVEAGLISAEEAAEEGNIYEEMRTEMAAEMEGISVDTTLDIAVNPVNRCIMRMDASCKLAEDEENVVLDLELLLGENPAESDQIALNITASENDETVMSLKSVLSYTTTGSVDIYSVLLSADVDGEIATMNFTATYNNDNHDYELALTLDEERYAMTGKLENSADKLHFTIDQMEGEGETVPVGLSITVENTPDCEIPAVPEYTDISSMIDLGSLLGTSGYAEEEYWEEDYEYTDDWDDEYTSEDYDYVEDWEEDYEYSEDVEDSEMAS